MQRSFILVDIGGGRLAGSVWKGSRPYDNWAW